MSKTFAKKIKSIMSGLLLASTLAGVTLGLAHTQAPTGIWQHHQLPGQASLRGSAILGDSLWVTGSDNSVFVSQDAGKTWQNKSVQPVNNTDFRDIALFDSSSAVVMGIGSGKQSALYKTLDGGDHWQLLYQNQDEQGFFDSIAFWDRDNGLLMGDPVDGYYVIKRTTDGGKTWQRIKQGKIPAILQQEAAFAASGNTLIVGDTGQAWFTTGGFAAAVYQSKDHGQSWTRMAVPLFNKTATAGGYGLALNQSGKVFVVGGDYQQRAKAYANMATLVQHDWQLSKSGEHGLRTAMSCQRQICIATGKTGNDISYDDGQHWQTLANPKGGKDDKGFYTLASDHGVFVAAGHSGKVATYTLNHK